jgi:hypothetical protein
MDCLLKLRLSVCFAVEHVAASCFVILEVLGEGGSDSTETELKMITSMT